MIQRTNAAFAATLAVLITLAPFAAITPRALAAGAIVIDTCQELQLIGNDEGYPLDGDYVLGGNIDCSLTNPANQPDGYSGLWADGTGFDPIGSASGENYNITHESFTGSFDGQGHTISNLYIYRDVSWTDTTGYYIGLFATIGNGGTVENLHLADVDITSTNGNDVGALAGGLAGTATNISATGSVTGHSRVGGLVGVHTSAESFPNSSPLVYSWNGSEYTYTTDVGNLLPKELSGTDYAQIDRALVSPKSDTYSFKITEEYNETVYFDALSLITLDHAPGYTVVEPLSRSAGESDLRTVSDTPSHPLLGCTDERGNDCLVALRDYDDEWSYANRDGQYSPANLKKSFVLDFGDLSAASTTNVQLVLRGARDYAASAQYPGNSARSVQVKDASGAWVEVYTKNQLASDGSPRLRTLDLTGKFLSNDYHVKVAFDTFNANYFAIDTSPQVPVTKQVHTPSSVTLGYHGFSAIDRTHYYYHDYGDVRPTPADLFVNQYGHFTKYGDVTPLLTATDDHSVVMRYGDELSVDFAYEAPAPGMERSYILANDALYKHATYSNLGEYGVNADYLPYRGMTSYGSGMTPYPSTPENDAYRAEWNTRVYGGPYADALTPHSSTIIDSYSAVAVHGSWIVGGLVGQNDKTIYHSYASGTVNGDYTAGGLVGLNEANGYIYDAYATGAVTGHDTLGGFVGNNSQGRIDRAYSTGTVTGDTHYQIGGFAGASYISTAGHGIHNSFTTSAVSATAEDGTVGGFVGYAWTDGPTDGGNFYYNTYTNGQGSSSNNADEPEKVSSSSVFLSNTTQRPLDQWDFTSGTPVWYTVLAMYPQLVALRPVDAPVLTPVATIPDKVSVKKALYTFTTDKSCTIVAEDLVTNDPRSEAEFHISEAPEPGRVIEASFRGLRGGYTYSVNFACLDDEENMSNILSIGTFTTTRPSMSGSAAGAAPATAVTAEPVEPESPVAASSTPAGPTTPTTPPAPLRFTKNLKLLSEDPEVKLLQQFLNTAGFTVASSGPGSKGQETNRFGALTKAALIKYQEAHAADILTPSGLTRGTGNFFERTRAFVNQQP